MTNDSTSCSAAAMSDDASSSEAAERMIVEAVDCINALLTQEEQKLDTCVKLARVQQILLTGLIHAQSEDEVKDFLMKVTKLLHMINSFVSS